MGYIKNIRKYVGHEPILTAGEIIGGDSMDYTVSR